MIMATPVAQSQTKGSITSVGRVTRDSEICDYCRSDKKKCIDHESDERKRCQLCVEKSRSCSRRRRAPRQPDDGSLLTATVFATLTLLNLCISQCGQIFSIVCPFPCADPMDYGSAFKSQSWTLSHALRSTASVLRINDRLLHGLVAVLLQSQHMANAWYMERISREDVLVVNACVSNILSRSKQQTLQDRFGVPMQDLMWWYKDTEDKVRRLLEALDLSSALYQDMAIILRDAAINLKKAFPACHIAFWNGDGDVAFALWAVDPWATDLLGRGFPHIVAEAGNLYMLQRIDSYCKAALTHTWSDVRGLTILGAATCSRAAGCVEYLLNVSPIGPFGALTYSSLLDLALAAGNPDIVAGLAGLNIAMPAVTMLMVKIIELGRGDLSEHFLHLLDDGQIVSQGELKRLVYLAADMKQELYRHAAIVKDYGWTGRWIELQERHKAMVDLHEHLQKCHVTMPGAEAAVNSLTSLDYR